MPQRRTAAAAVVAALLVAAAVTAAGAVAAAEARARARQVDMGGSESTSLSSDDELRQKADRAEAAAEKEPFDATMDMVKKLAGGSQAMDMGSAANEDADVDDRVVNDNRNGIMHITHDYADAMDGELKDLKDRLAEDENERRRTNDEQVQKAKLQDKLDLKEREREQKRKRKESKVLEESLKKKREDMSKRQDAVAKAAEQEDRDAEEVTNKQYELQATQVKRMSDVKEQELQQAQQRWAATAESQQKKLVEQHEKDQMELKAKEMTKKQEVVIKEQSAKKEQVNKEQANKDEAKQKQEFALKKAQEADQKEKERIAEAKKKEEQQKESTAKEQKQKEEKQKEEKQKEQKKKEETTKEEAKKVEAYQKAPKNLALHAACTQSSCYWNQCCSKAVDGNRNGYWQWSNANSVFHSDNPVGFHWVRIYLRGNFNVFKVLIFNRQDCCSERINPFAVRLYNAANKLVAQTSFNYVTYQYTWAGRWANVNWVEVQLLRPDYLQLAEVEVWGAAS